MSLLFICFLCFCKATSINFLLPCFLHFYVMLHIKRSRVQNHNQVCSLPAVIWLCETGTSGCSFVQFQMGWGKVFLHKSPYSLYILLRCYRYQPCFPLIEKIWVNFRTLEYITRIYCHWRTALCFWVREKPSFLSCSYMSMDVGACRARAGNPPGQAGTTATAIVLESRKVHGPPVTGHSGVETPGQHLLCRMSGSPAEVGAEALHQLLCPVSCIQVRPGDLIHSLPWEKNPALLKKQIKELFMAWK